MAKPGAEECSEEGGGMSAFGFLSFVLAVVNGKLDRKPPQHHPNFHIIIRRSDCCPDLDPELPFLVYGSRSVFIINVWI